MDKLRSYRFGVLFKNNENTIKFEATESYAGQGDIWRSAVSEMRVTEYNIDECDCHRQQILNIDDVYIDLSTVVFIAMTEIVKDY